MLRNCSNLIAFAVTFSAALLPLGARGDDRNAFLTDAHRFTAMHSFKLQIDSVGPATSSTKYLTYVAPNKLRLDEPSRKLAVVVIGKLIWLRTANGKWQNERLAPGADPLGAVHDPSIIVKDIDGKTIKYDGARQFDGVPTHVYDLAAAPRTGRSATTTRIWIGVRDGFPRKIVQRNGPFSSTATYTDLNGALSISGP